MMNCMTPCEIKTPACCNNSYTGFIYAGFTIYSSAKGYAKNQCFHHGFLLSEKMLQVKRRVPIYSRYFGKTHYKMHMAPRRQKVTENYYVAFFQRASRWLTILFAGYSG